MDKTGFIDKTQRCDCSADFGERIIINITFILQVGPEFFGIFFCIHGNQQKGAFPWLCVSSPAQMMV